VPGQSWTVSRDPATQQASVDWRGGGSKDYPWGSEQVQEHLQFRADDVRPEIAAAHGDASMIVRLKDRELVWRTLLDVTSDAHDFRIEVTRELAENGKPIRRKQWHSTIPRDGQ